MQTKDITSVSLFYKVVPRGMRKERQISYRLDIIDGHKTLTPDELNEYERKAWQYIDSIGYQNPPKTARLQTNFGQKDGGMIMIRLLGNQGQLICR